MQETGRENNAFLLFKKKFELNPGQEEAKRRVEIINRVENFDKRKRAEKPKEKFDMMRRSFLLPVLG